VIIDVSPVSPGLVGLGILGREGDGESNVRYRCTYCGGQIGVKGVRSTILKLVDLGV
jgi:hypothetical protein